MLLGIGMLSQAHAAEDNPSKDQLMGGRFLTFNTIIRVKQIEVTRDTSHGPDESEIHSPAEAKIFREAIDKAWPGAKITWAFRLVAKNLCRNGKIIRLGKMPPCGI